MNITSRILAGFALTALVAGCGNGGEATDAAEEQLATDGTEAMSASSQSTNLASVVFEGVTQTDPTKAAGELGAPTKLWPAGCVTRAKDPTNPNVVDVTFNDCIGPFGLVHLNGTEIVTFSPGSNGALHVNITGKDLTANGKPITYSADADVTFSGAQRNVVWHGSWTRTTEKGLTVAHTSDLTIDVDTSAGCSTSNGTAQTTVESRGVNTTITGYEVCRDSTGAIDCPTGSVTHTGKLSGKTVTIKFDGSDVADVTGPAGHTFDVPLICPAAPSSTGG
jgi:hypothetical protein